MKKVFLLLLFISVHYFAFAAKSTKKVREDINSVTVFLSGAQINSVAQTTIDAGLTDLVLQSLPSNINRQSIQVAGTGDFNILSVSIQDYTINEENRRAEVKLLEDSIELLSIKLEIEQNKKYALEQEESMIISNKNISGLNNGFSIALLEDLGDLFRDRLVEIRTKSGAIARTSKKIQEKINNLKRQLQEATTNQNKATTQLVITVSAKAKCNAYFNFSYLVYDAGWSPSYDIRVSSTKSPAQIIYKANVTQYTGIDWDNVALTLSTGNPVEGGTKPELFPQVLDFADPISLLKPRSASMNYLKSNENASDMQMAAPAGSASELTAAVESAFARLFEISVPWTINSDGKPNTVEIQNSELPAAYSYQSVPKLDPAAYLVAGITEWEKLNLVSAPANVYFEGTFIGETYINTLETKDTLSISLGKDKGVIIKREQIKNLNSERDIGGSKKVLITYEISFRNEKKEDITLRVEDQIPIVKDKDIELRVLSTQGAEPEPDTGRLVWKVRLKSAEEKKIKFSYEVKYPKDKVVPGL